jgi:hypothetical protein
VVQKICFNAEKGKCVAITEKVTGVTFADGLSTRDKFKELLKDPTWNR